MPSLPADPGRCCCIPTFGADTHQFLPEDGKQTPFILTPLRPVLGPFRLPSEWYWVGGSLLAGRTGDRIPVGARFSAPFQTGRGTHPVACTMDTGSFTWVNRLGRGADHPTHLPLRLKKEKSYTSAVLL